ncbi:hypothetical protein ACJMK2_008079 [Sinanodonta woodiana]|uniref:DH domain-containing protein n=1 Tax=Sinanodonta woodiana TaxID=1069815 RepID=A0ABD3VKH4_SINWO
MFCLFVCLIKIFNVSLTIFQSYRYDVCCEAVYSDTERLHVIQSLIETENSYIDSLGKVVNDCQPMVTSLFGAQPHLMNAFIYLRLMLIHHVKSQEKLKDRSIQNISSFFRGFAEQEILNVYSLYINSYSVAVDVLKEADKTKQTFRNFLQTQCRSTIDGLMIKPVQRFPQFILILKDILKYTPDDEVEKRQLQDCLALLEHFGYQLNERKRRSEQTLEAQRIYSKSTKLKSTSAERGNHWLIRQDDVGKLCNEANGNQETKERRLLLMNACLVSAYMPSREGKDYALKWSVDLKYLDLKEQSMSPGLAVKERREDNKANLAELTILKRDSSTLEQMIDLAKTLYRSYPGVLGTLQKNLESLQKNIQKNFNTTGIEIFDSSRNRTYSFLFESAKTKQEWCNDFLMAKYNSDSSNNPAWSIQEGASADSAISPACFIQPLSADVPRQFTTMKCATKVIIPVLDTPGIGLPHLWVCSATESLGKVSIISLHSGRTNLLESFEACRSDITCAEMIPTSDTVQHELEYSMDTVWMGTADAEIIVFAVSNPHNVTRAPLQTFNTTDVVITLKYIKNRVFGGCRMGTLLILSRHEDGVWTQSSAFEIGHSPLSTFLLWESDILIGCSKSIVVFDVDSLCHKASIPLQTEGECDGSVKCMVQSGQGLWVSFQGKSILCLYHIVSRKLLQQYDVNMDLNTFRTGSAKSHMTFQGSINHEITCLMSSPGLLWVGTSSGMILTYPLPLNQNSDPKLILRPNISMHGHSGSSTLFNIVPFGFVASHAHTSFPPESSSPSACQDYGEVSSCKLKTSVHGIQEERNYETRIGEDKAYHSLSRNAAGKSANNNNPRVIQDNSDINVREAQSQMLDKPSNVIMDTQIVPTSTQTQVKKSSTLDGAAFVNSDIPEHTNGKDRSMLRPDSGYGSTKSTLSRNLTPNPRQNSRNIIKKSGSGGLSRQIAIRDSRDKSSKSFVSSTRSISISESWKLDSTNSYIVISGGDGYKDWKNRLPNSYRNDEALLLAWMIKIQGPS